MCLILPGVLSRGGTKYTWCNLVYCTARADKVFLVLLNEISARTRLITATAPMQRQVTVHDAFLIAWLRYYLYRPGPFDIIHAHSRKAGLIGRLGALGTSTRAF